MVEFEDCLKLVEGDLNKCFQVFSISDGATAINRKSELV